MALSCGMSMVKYGLFIFNLVCAVSAEVHDEVSELEKKLSIVIFIGRWIDFDCRWNHSSVQNGQHQGCFP
jgi:hypothetical protein